jgi:hypothetical protein
MNTNKDLVRLLTFMNKKTRRTSFVFYNEVFKPKSLEHGKDLPALIKYIKGKNFIKVIKDDYIISILDLANNLKYVKPSFVECTEYGGTKICKSDVEPTGGIEVTDKGFDFLSESMKSNTTNRMNLWISISTALIASLLSYFLNKNNINILQTQIVNIENSINIKDKK